MNWGSYNDLGGDYWSCDLLPTIQLIRERSSGDRLLTFSWLCWWVAFEI
jgi:hypothetical protein